VLAVCACAIQGLGKRARNCLHAETARGRAVRIQNLRAQPPEAPPPALGRSCQAGEGGRGSAQQVSGLEAGMALPSPSRRAAMYPESLVKLPPAKAHL
jgi:hypothetical protein